MNIKSNHQSGIVSIFLVVFSALLVTIVTVGYINVMVINQQQTTDTDLSQSAYDSAMAGVEDAKRLALIYRACGSSFPVGSECEAAKDAIDAFECDTIQAGLLLTATDEVAIQEGAASNDLNQAYTCVKMKYETDNIEKQIEDGETQLIPLRATGDFNEIKISWFKPETAPPAPLSLRGDSSLPQKASWGAGPPIMRTQMIQTGATFTQDSFDKNDSGESNTNTVFLYPRSVGTSTVNLITDDPRPAGSPQDPTNIRCDAGAFSGGGYACSATLELPDPIGGTDRDNAFLVIRAIYSDTDYTLELFKDGVPVPFDGVQPLVDSTGRASNLFRRVEARIEFSNNNINYPAAAVDVGGDVCKDFIITDRGEDYDDGDCTP